jgi:type 1 glutamine amidotransferase
MYSRADWHHSAGSNLVGWAKRWGNSPIVYLQGGDDAAAMANEYFRRLVHNAIRWVSSDDARSWARVKA